MDCTGTTAAWGILMGLLLLAAARGGEPAPPRGGRRTVRDFGAAGDGTTDDTAAFQRAVDAATGDLLVPRGTYRLTRPVVVDLAKVGWTSLAGSGAARLVMAGPGPAIRLVGTHGGTAAPHTVKPAVWDRERTPCVDALEIVGAHAQAVGIEATGTMQLILTRLTIRKALHAIQLTRRNRNVLVAHCHLYENRGVGLYLDDVNLHQINVAACHISYNAAGGIVVRAGNVRNLQVCGCDIEGNMAPDGPPTANVLIDSTGGDAGTAEVAIVGCTIQHTGRAPDSANVRYIGLDARGETRGNVTIADNVLSDVQTNVHIRTARGVSILGNTLWTGFRHNLLVEDSSNVVIGPNVLDRNPAYRDEDKGAECAVVFRRCTDLTVTGLHVNGVRRAAAGLLLEGCRRVNLANCSVLDCDRVGVLLREVADSRVAGCLIRNDRDDAEGWIALQATGGRGNLIAGNLCGGPIQADPDAAHLQGNRAGSEEHHE